MLSLGACRSTEKAASRHSAVEYQSVAKVEKADSAAFRLQLRVDSPKISIEYLDSPRRRVAVEASRIKVRRENVQQVKQDSLVIVNMKKTEADRQTEKPSTPSLQLRYIIIIVLLIMLVFRQKQN